MLEWVSRSIATEPKSSGTTSRLETKIELVGSGSNRWGQPNLSNLDWFYLDGKCRNPDKSNRSHWASTSESESNFFRSYLHFGSLVTTFHSTWESIYQPRFEKSSNISLVVSSLVLKLIPKIPASLELSNVIIYTGSLSTWVISGNPGRNLREGSGEGEREFATSTIFSETSAMRGNSNLKDECVKHTKFLPIKTLYMINVRITG